MQSGKLRHLTPVEKSIDGEWTFFKNIYTDWDFSSGSEQLDSETGYAVTNARIRARRDASITTKMRLTINGRIYYIEAILPDRTDARNNVLDCVEREP